MDTVTDPAGFYMQRAEQAIGADAPLGALTSAVMAFVEEQRTANLIAYWRMLDDTGSAEDVQTDVGWQIQQRLGR